MSYSLSDSHGALRDASLGPLGRRSPGRLPGLRASTPPAASLVAHSSSTPEHENENDERELDATRNEPTEEDMTSTSNTDNTWYNTHMTDVDPYHTAPYHQQPQSDRHYSSVALDDAETAELLDFDDTGPESQIEQDDDDLMPPPSPSLQQQQQPPAVDHHQDSEDDDDAEDADYTDEHEVNHTNDDQDSDMDESNASDEGGLMDWVEQSRRSGVPAMTVLQRLVNDYSQVSVNSKLLWRVAFNLSAHIQQSLVRASVRRQKLPHINTLDDVCSLVQRSKRIVVLTGAGISVAAGIPDFRSKQGIYPRLKREFNMDSPEAMFDMEYFRENPSMFYSFAKELWPGCHHPTVTHRFIAMLEQHGKLLRNYTQNIDAIETRAGITRLLQCHGSFATAKCMTCRRVVHGMEIHADIMAQTIAKCTVCWSTEALADDTIDRSAPTFGVMKPEIVFFGESLPETFRTCLASDKDTADLVIVIGSSLKVQPVAGMLERFAKDIPMVLINREVVGAPDEFDVELLGLADETCLYLTEKLGWTLPEVDPSKDTFSAPLTSGGSDASSLTTVAAPSHPAATASSPPPSTAAPIFIPPNRYCFSGSVAPRPNHADRDSGEISSSDCSSPELLEMPRERERERDEMQIGGYLGGMTPGSSMDEFQAPELSISSDPFANGSRTPLLNGSSTPLASPRTPLASSSSAAGLLSPRGSPRAPIRPPPLHLGESKQLLQQGVSSASGGGQHDPYNSLVCTPTKSSRFMLHSPLISGLSHHGSMTSPKFKAQTTPQTTPRLVASSSTASADMDALLNSAWAGGGAAGTRRKGTDGTEVDSLLSSAWAGAGAKRKATDGTEPSVTTPVFAALPPPTPRTRPSSSGGHLLPPAAVSEVVNTPQVKRRKIEEMKQQPTSSAEEDAAAAANGK